MKRYTPGLEIEGPTWAASRRVVMDECGDGEFVFYKDAYAELTRLRAELAEERMFTDTRRAMYELALKQRDEAESKLAEARALVEKREAQIEWLAQKCATGGGFTRPPTQWWFRSGPDGEMIEYDGTRAGLLAAVDEATKP